MQFTCVALILVTLSAVHASRVQSYSKAHGGKTCHISENDESLKYGISGSWKVKSCMFCKFHQFLTETLAKEMVSEPQQEEKTCKCFYSPTHWEANGLETKFWFQFRVGHHQCTKHDCGEVFFDWGNNFLKKKDYPGDNEIMPVNQFIQSHDNYDLKCDDAEPTGIVLPSPGSKITELRLQIEKCTDPEEKARLQALLDELLRGKEVEVFAYDLEADWGIEREADATSDGEHHTFFLKPCVSQLDNEAGPELGEIIELCGPGEMGTSMKGGRLKVSYDIDKPWGLERACTVGTEECEVVRNAAKEGNVPGEILSFRLRPCVSPSHEEITPWGEEIVSPSGEEITDLAEILAEKGCGAPSAIPDADQYTTLLVVKIDVSSKYDESALLDTDKLPFPCTE